MENPYNQVAYHSAPFPQAHLNRLASAGILQGLRPPDICACRVLELGCGDGSHLIPMAVAFPGSQFVGIDLAEMPIAQAQATVAELGLGNIRFEVADVMEFGGDRGSFDYVIAHGLYSWVPEFVQEGIMALIGRVLSDSGVAYISYNCYPAWHPREMTRAMVRMHTRGITDPVEIRNRAIALLAGIHRSQGDREPYKSTVLAEMERIIAKDAFLCFHDDFGDHNHPVYLTEFVRRARERGLEYLADAEPEELDHEDFSPDMREALHRIQDPVEREQFYDLLTVRGFRRTLLCRAGTALDRSMPLEAFARLYFSAQLMTGATKSAVSGAGKMVFVTAKGAKIEVNQPLVKAALWEMSQAYPGALTFGELLDRVRVADPLMDPSDAAETLRQVIVRVGASQAMEVSPTDWPFAAGVTERPEASPLARRQARLGTRVTTLRHRIVDMDDEGGRKLLGLLDGTRDLTALGMETGMDAGNLRAALGQMWKLGLLVR